MTVTSLGGSGGRRARRRLRDSPASAATAARVRAAWAVRRSDSLVAFVLSVALVSAYATPPTAMMAMTAATPIRKLRPPGAIGRRGSSKIRPRRRARTGPTGVHRNPLSGKDFHRYTGPGSSPASSCDHANARNVAEPGASGPGPSNTGRGGGRVGGGSGGAGRGSRRRARLQRHAPVGASASAPNAANSAAPTAALRAGCGVVTTGSRVCSESRCVTRGILAPPPTTASAARPVGAVPLRSVISSKAEMTPSSGDRISSCSSSRVSRMSAR